jgi:hypothetical protein
MMDKVQNPRNSDNSVDFMYYDLFNYAVRSSEHVKWIDRMLNE